MRVDYHLLFVSSLFFNISPIQSVPIETGAESSKSLGFRNNADVNAHKGLELRTNSKGMLQQRAPDYNPGESYTKSLKTGKEMAQDSQERCMAAINQRNWAAVIGCVSTNPAYLSQS